MTDPYYRKCRTCRFCIHSEVWACTRNSKAVRPEDTCDSYRPGCCESCSNWKEDGSVCGLTGEEVYSLQICDDYDPHCR